MKLIKVTKTVDEEYTDEEQDETVRQFEGDMADAPEDAFDEADAAPSAGSKVKRRKVLLSPEEQAQLAEEPEKKTKDKLEKEKALKADLKARAATWLARLPADIGKAKKVSIDVTKIRVTRRPEKRIPGEVREAQAEPLRLSGCHRGCDSSCPVRRVKTQLSGCLGRQIPERQEGVGKCLEDL